MRTYRIAAIPGDGIGQEVIAAGIKVLEACARRDGGFAVRVDHFDWGSERYKKTGAFMPENASISQRPNASVGSRARRMSRSNNDVGLRLPSPPFDIRQCATRIYRITSPSGSFWTESEWVIGVESRSTPASARVHKGLPERSRLTSPFSRHRALVTRISVRFELPARGAQR